MASLSDSKVQLAATAVVSAVVVAGAILSYQRLQQGDRVSRLKQSIPGPSGSDSALQTVGSFFLLFLILILIFIAHIITPLSISQHIPTVFC